MAVSRPPDDEVSVDQLRALADQRRRQISENYVKINDRNRQLHSLLQGAAGTASDAQRRLYDVRERLAGEQNDYRCLTKLKDELANYTYCYRSLIHQLEQVNCKIEAKQSQLDAAQRRVDDASCHLAKLKLQNALADKKAEIRLLDNEIRELTVSCVPDSLSSAAAAMVVDSGLLPAAAAAAASSASTASVKPWPPQAERPKAAVEPFKAETDVLLCDYVESEGFKEALSAVDEILYSGAPAESTDSANCAQPAVVGQSATPPPDLIPASDKCKFLGAHCGGGGGPAASEFGKVEPDKIHLRNDTLRAAKRRSWADHHATAHGSTSDEAEHIRLLLCRELKRGKTSVNLSWILDHLNSGANGKDVEEEAGGSVLLEAAAPPEVLVPPVPEPSSSTSSAKSGSSGGGGGILRTTGGSGGGNKPRRSVQFDPLALLLDAALEGELDLVKSSAAHLANVSLCYEEGITALHNAICAGHYDVVRFLTDAGADVNAQDSDGWTPLHCAASCNNLPMAKFLVENGACVFAITFSDQETPAEKCEEAEEGYLGCSQFLLGLQDRMGVAGNGKVYAAFSFEGQNDDEISFDVGDELKILAKDTEEPGWWWAVDLSTGQEGYVPRNLLSMYPRTQLGHNE